MDARRPSGELLNMEPLTIGIDLGGTKIEGVTLTKDGTVLNRTRVKTPVGDYQGTIDAIVKLVAEIAGDTSDARVGVGTPGSVNPSTGLHRNSNSTCLNGKPFETDLAAALPFPLRTANDANCFALSEARDGAGSGKKSVFGVIIGTGCGGGVVIDGKLINGANGIAGEWGHMALPRRNGEVWESRPCYCGRSDCLEQYICGTAIEAEYLAETGEKASVAQIAAANDPVSVAVIDRFYDRFAESLVSVVNLFDPDVIVLGGGVSNLDSIYEVVPRFIHQRAFCDECSTPVLKNVHGDSSGVRGAAWLWSSP